MQTKLSGGAAGDKSLRARVLNLYKGAYGLACRLAADKRLIVCCVLGFSLVQGVFAQTGGSSFGVEERVKIIIDFLSSPWVKGICVIALIVECIGMITAGRQEPGMFKKFIPWIAGTVLFMSAGSITTMFIKPSDANLSDVLN
jgi:type IV secretory pathway VirB2 component (pilin)